MLRMQSMSIRNLVLCPGASLSSQKRDSSSALRRSQNLTRSSPKPRSTRVRAYCCMPSALSTLKRGQDQQSLRAVSLAGRVEVDGLFFMRGATVDLACETLSLWDLRRFCSSHFFIRLIQTPINNMNKSILVDEPYNSKSLASLSRSKELLAQDCSESTVRLMEATLRSHKDTITALTTQVETLHHKERRQQEIIRAKDETIRELRQTVSKNDSKLVYAESKEVEIQQLKAIYAQQISGLIYQHEKAKQLMAAEFMAERAKLVEQVKYLQMQARHTLMAGSSLEGELIGKNTLIEGLVMESAGLRQHLFSTLFINERLQHYVPEYQELGRAYNQACKKIKEQGQEIEDYSRSLQSLRSELAQLKFENSSLRKKHSEKSKAFAKVRETLRLTRKDLAQLKKQSKTSFAELSKYFHKQSNRIVNTAAEIVKVYKQKFNTLSQLFQDHKQLTKIRAGGSIQRRKLSIGQPKQNLSMANPENSKSDYLVVDHSRLRNNLTSRQQKNQEYSYRTHSRQSRGQVEHRTAKPSAGQSQMQAVSKEVERELDVLQSEIKHLLQNRTKRREFTRT